MSLIVIVAHAQSLVPAKGDPILGPGCNFITGELHFACIPLYVAYLIQFFFATLGFWCVLQIMFGGFQIATANLLGNDKEAGMGRIRWSLIGLAIGILAYVILDFFLNGIAS